MLHEGSIRRGGPKDCEVKAAAKKANRNPREEIYVGKGMSHVFFCPEPRRKITCSSTHHGVLSLEKLVLPQARMVVSYGACPVRSSTVDVGLFLLQNADDALLSTWAWQSLLIARTFPAAKPSPSFFADVG